MRSQAREGTSKDGYRKLRPEGPKKTLRKERVQVTSAMGKNTRGGVGAKRKKKQMKAQAGRGGSRAKLKNKNNAVKNSTNPKRPITTPAQAQKKKGR